MKKIEVLLDETTIINFKLLTKLVSRYRSHLTIALIIFFSSFLYFYFSQPVIYSVTVPMKTISKHTVSNDLSALLPVENTNILTFNELNVSLSSYGFLKNLAIEIAKYPSFAKMDFGIIQKNSHEKGADIKLDCKKVESCIIDRLASMIKNNFIIEQGLTEDRYNLVISTLDSFTVNELKKIIPLAIENYRIELRQYLISKEITSVNSLIKEGQAILSKSNGFKLLETDEVFQLTHSEVKEKLRTLQSSINNEVANVSALKARFLENQKVLLSYRDEDKLVKHEKISLKKKIDEVNQNIAILSNIPSTARSGTDNEILLKLHKEKNEIESIQQAKKNVLDSDDDHIFDDSQQVHEKSIEFEYNVAKNKLLGLEQEFQSTLKLREKLTENKISNESTISKVKSDLDFLKNLESKQLSLKLLSSTITADIVFEEAGKDSREFRIASLLKVLVFCFMFTFFFFIFSIVVRFVLDDRIYSEDDLLIYFTTLDFIGDVPAFDS